MLRRSQNFGYYLNIYIQTTERSNHLRIVTIENSHFDIYFIPCSPSNKLFDQNLLCYNGISGTFVLI